MPLQASFAIWRVRTRLLNKMIAYSTTAAAIKMIAQYSMLGAPVPDQIL